MSESVENAGVEKAEKLSEDGSSSSSSSPSSSSSASKEATKVSPPHDLPLNLDLYNYDSPDAQSCPYVLTSPRSLEACSRVGIKPVDLLRKSFEEFSGDLEPGKPIEEVCKLYDEQEKHRIILLEKCQAERDFIIWRTSSKPRSQSLSPCRRNRLQHNPDDLSHGCEYGQPHNLSSQKSSDDILIASRSHDGRQSRLGSRSCSARNRNPQTLCWSTPASPYFRGSSNLFVRITSPVVCAKLQNFPRNKMRLPPKEMKILEVILQKYEKQDEEEHLKARALRMWDREKEERERKKEKAEMERWKNLALKQKRSCSEERSRFTSEKEDMSSSYCCSRQMGSQEDGIDAVVRKRRSFKTPRNQNRTQSFEDSRLLHSKSTERMSRFDADQRMKAIRMREEKVEKRRQEIIHKRDDVLKKSAEELKGKIKQVKENQQELDKAMEQWREQILNYQYASNVRAAEKVAELCEQRRLKAKQERLARQAEHKKKMQKIEAEEYAKLQEMMERLRSKDERCKAFVQEKQSTMVQSRQLAQAASDLRELIRQKLDKDSFLKRSQKAALEARLQQLEPRMPDNRRRKKSAESS